MARWNLAGNDGHRYGPAALGVLMLISACTTEAQDTQDATVGEGSGANTATPAPIDEAASTPAAPAASTPATPAAAPSETGAIAMGSGAVDGQRVQLEITRFGTENDLLTMAFALRTEEPDEFFNHPGVFRDDQAEDSADDYSGIYLVDPTNNTKYLVVRDTAGVCLCSTYDAFHDEAVLYATFPTPPPEITEMTVHVPNFQPVPDVPITR